MIETFTFRSSWTKALNDLPVEVRNEVFNAILAYTSTGEVLEMGDTAQVAFLFIRNDIDVEVEEGKERRRRQSEGAKKGMANRWGNRDAELDNINNTDPVEVDKVDKTDKTDKLHKLDKSLIDLIEKTVFCDVEKERAKEREMSGVEVEESLEKTQDPSSPEKGKEKAVCKHTEKESEKEPPKARKVFRPPTVEDVYGFAMETGASHADPEEFHDFYTSKGWKVGREPMKDWKAAFRRWERERKKRDEAEEKRWNEKNNRTGNGNDRTQRAGPLWSPTDDQRAHPEKYYHSTL